MWAMCTQFSPVRMHQYIDCSVSHGRICDLELVFKNPCNSEISAAHICYTVVVLLLSVVFLKLWRVYEKHLYGKYTERTCAHSPNNMYSSTFCPHVSSDLQLHGMNSFRCWKHSSGTEAHNSRIAIQKVMRLASGRFQAWMHCSALSHKCSTGFISKAEKCRCDFEDYHTIGVCKWTNATWQYPVKKLHSAVDNGHPRMSVSCLQVD